VKAMHLMLQHEKPDDYVIATGTSHSVRDFVETAAKVLEIDVRWTGAGFEEVGLDRNGKVIIRIDEEFYRPVEVESLRGDASKARRQLGWSPQVSFAGLVDMMVKNDFERLARRS
jgi:GDPmannose 4,6-dehydratase